MSFAPICDPIGNLRDALIHPLPGTAGQLRMAPMPRSAVDTQAGSAGRYRDAAVVVLLYPGLAGWSLVLTRRTETLASHQGQISLPGGRIETGETVEEAALRELHEELDVAPSAVTILGRLTPLHIPHSRFYVQPVVACTPNRPPFRPSSAEVSEVIEVQLIQLLDPATRQSELWQLRGELTDVPFFAIGNHKVWGATAMILSELIEVLGAPAQAAS